MSAAYFWIAVGFDLAVITFFGWLGLLAVVLATACYRLTFGRA